MDAAYTSTSEKKIAASKLQLLVEQNRVTFFASNVGVPTTVALLLLLIGKSNPIVVGIWLASGYTLCLIRFLHHQRLEEFSDTNRPLETWENDLVMFSSLSGCFWSACGILFMDTSDIAQSLTIVAALFGVISGAVPALTSHRQIFLAFVLSTWVPVGLYFLVQSQILFTGIAVMGTIFSAIIISFSNSQIRAIEYSLRVRYENFELLEELQIQKQKEEEANKAKSRFLAVASHDLRQPIHAMRLFSDSLSQRLTERNSRAIMAKLNASIATLSELFDSLLDISKLDAETIAPEKRNVDVCALLKSLAAEVSAQCHAKGLRWTYRCPGSYYVQTDALLLERILRNLIWNAIKYTDTGGILIAARKRGDQLRIEIWDTGCGIPDTEQSEIFKEFHQVQTPGIQSPEGIGLGLSIVSRLCQLLGFTISLRSNPGQGSVFFLEMPLLPQPPKAAMQDSELKPQTHHPDSDLNGVQVLVVDDDQNILSATGQVLRSWGCKPLLASSHEAVKHLLEENTPDLILTDYNLGNSMTGDKIITLVHQEAGFKIPSLILTGDTFTEGLIKASSRCDLLLHKPLKPEILKRTIIRLLNQRAPD